MFHKSFEIIDKILHSTEQNLIKVEKSKLRWNVVGVADTTHACDIIDREYFIVAGGLMTTAGDRVWQLPRTLIIGQMI